MSTPVGLLAIVGLVLANAFFVATEFAIVAVRRSRLEQLAKAGSRSARAAKDIVDHLDSYIAACQFGITLASLGLGWVGEPVLAHLIEPAFAALPGPLAAGVAHTLAIAVAFSIVTALHIVAGELAPKGVALQRPEATSLWVAMPLQIFYRVFRWPINVLNAIGNATLKLLGFEPSSGHENVHSVEELRYLLQASHEAGVVEASEARIASRAFQFADRTARELMTPRTAIKALAVDLKADELVRQAGQAGHTRLPVFEKTLDDIVGVLNVRDLLAATPQLGEITVRTLAKPAIVIPMTRRADDILEDMRAQGATLVIVVDEFGGTSGLLTLHDLLEGLVGRLRARDSEPEIGPEEADGSRVVSGSASLREVTEAVGLCFTAEDMADADTLSGVVMSRLGRVPTTGDTVVIDTRTVTVESFSPQKVPRLRVRPRPAQRP
jgi:CBS domain containing-hemolysin-like protein